MTNEKDIKSLLKQYQMQTCENFKDINDDMDEIRGHLLVIEEMLINLAERGQKNDV